MPKMKTNSAAAKRFRSTGSGKIRRGKASGSHLLSHKNRKRTRRLRDNDTVNHANFKQIKILIPYK